MGKVIGHTAGNPCPLISYGTDYTITIDYQKVIRTVPAWMPWVPIVSSGDWAKWVPLFPFAKIASASTTTLTASSASEAGWFDPADDEVNNYWLSANSGDQKATYWDTSDDITHGGLEMTSLGGGAIYSEEQVVSSVSSTSITLSVAFTADPASDDVLLPGGIDENTLIFDHAVILGDVIDVHEINRWGAEFKAQRVAHYDAVLKYDDLCNEFKSLISYGVIPANGCRNFKIERD